MPFRLASASVRIGWALSFLTASVSEPEPPDAGVPSLTLGVKNSTPAGHAAMRPLN